MRQNGSLLPIPQAHSEGVESLPPSSDVCALLPEQGYWVAGSGPHLALSHDWVRAMTRPGHDGACHNACRYESNLEEMREAEPAISWYLGLYLGISSLAAIIGTNLHPTLLRLTATMWGMGSSVRSCDESANVSAAVMKCAL